MITEAYSDIILLNKSKLYEIGDNNPQNISNKLRIAAVNREIDEILFLDAADFIDSIINDKNNETKNKFNVSAEYVILTILKIGRISHQKILFFLMKNVGKVLDCESICKSCGTKSNSLRVQISHIRSHLRKNGIYNLIQSVRSHDLGSKNGYLILEYELSKLIDNYALNDKNNLDGFEVHAI